MNYKNPKFWAFVIVIIVAIGAGIGLLSNRMKEPKGSSIDLQAPKPYSIVYLNPIFSVTGEAFADARQENDYQFEEGIFKVTSKIEAENITVVNPVYKEEGVGNRIALTGGTLDVSKYSHRRCFHVLTPDGIDTGYAIYEMDDEVWISHWDWYGKNRDALWCEYILKIK